ncbi:hypothetical protein [Desulfocastanea catecholica]
MSDHPFHQFSGTEGYVASRALQDAINVVLALERPLLLKGESGIGKTLLAHHVAAALGMELLDWILALLASRAQLPKGQEVDLNAVPPLGTPIKLEEDANNLSRRAARTTDHFKYFRAFYFHNCIYEKLYTDFEKNSFVTTAELMREYGKRYRLILVGDAAMSPPCIVFWLSLISPR